MMIAEHPPIYPLAMATPTPLYYRRQHNNNNHNNNTFTLCHLSVYLALFSACVHSFFFPHPILASLPQFLPK